MGYSQGSNLNISQKQFAIICSIIAVLFISADLELIWALTQTTTNFKGPTVS